MSLKVDLSSQVHRFPLPSTPAPLSDLIEHPARIASGTSPSPRAAPPPPARRLLPLKGPPPPPASALEHGQDVARRVLEPGDPRPGLLGTDDPALVLVESVIALEADAYLRKRINGSLDVFDRKLSTVKLAGSWSSFG